MAYYKITQNQKIDNNETYVMCKFHDSFINRVLPMLINHLEHYASVLLMSYYSKTCIPLAPYKLRIKSLLFGLIFFILSPGIANSFSFSLSNELSRKDRAVRLGIKLKKVPTLDFRYGLPPEFRNWITQSPYTYYELGIILNPYLYSKIPLIPWIGKTLRIRFGLGSKTLSTTGDLKGAEGNITYTKDSIYKLQAQDMGLYFGILSDLFRSKSFYFVRKIQTFLRINWLHFYIPLLNINWSLKNMSSCKILESENKKIKKNLQSYSLFLFHLELGLIF